MNATDYDYLCDFLLESSGLHLGPDKEYLIKSRLVPLAQTWELDNVEELVRELRKGGNDQLGSSVAESMTTNETSFFRDKQPFDDLKTTMLPQILQERQTSRTLRIWCAACSTGQEPYSIAMLLYDEFPQLSNWSVEIVATDLSDIVLERAAEGIYSQFEVQRGLSIQRLMKHFTQVKSTWQINEVFRSQISWKQINLLHPFAHMGPFDIVFCRNVLIYFAIQSKQDILERIHQVMHKDAFLLLGAAETVLGICDKFQRRDGLKSSVYCSAADVAA